MKEVRILTLWQPWASLIAHKLKQNETRSWGTDYRGKLAIHAAKRPANTAEVVAIYDSLKDQGGTDQDVERLDKVLGCFLTWHDDLPYGAIVAIADLVDCLEMVESQPVAPVVSRRVVPISQQSPLELAVGNWQPGRYDWKLGNVVALPEPIPFKGGQGLRSLTDETVLQRLQEVIEL